MYFYNPIVLLPLVSCYLFISSTTLATFFIFSLYSIFTTSVIVLISNCFVSFTCLLYMCFVVLYGVECGCLKRLLNLFSGIQGPTHTLCCVCCMCFMFVYVINRVFVGGVGDAFLSFLVWFSFCLVYYIK